MIAVTFVKGRASLRKLALSVKRKLSNLFAQKFLTRLADLVSKESHVNDPDKSEALV